MDSKILNFIKRTNIKYTITIYNDYLITWSQHIYIFCKKKKSISYIVVFTMFLLQ